jgi:hypothetical protein
MKCITNLKATVSDGKITITGDVVEREFRFPSQQVTVPFVGNKNPHWAIHAQMSQEALFIKHLAAGVAIPLQEWIDSVANLVEPKLSYPPAIRKNANLTVEFVSDLEMSIQWQSSEDDIHWADVPGETSSTLNLKGLSGKWVRCRGFSAAGETFTPAQKLK